MIVFQERARAQKKSFSSMLGAVRRSPGRHKCSVHGLPLACTMVVRQA